MNKSNYFVLTGAPGVGKTTLLHALRSDGFTCVDEPAREILAEQRAKNGDALPDINPRKFTEFLLAHSIERYEAFMERSDPIIFDRGTIDSVGYASLFGLDASPFERDSEIYGYNKSVFVLAPWPEIYKTDDERKMTFEATIQFHEQLLAGYRRAGYELILVPSSSVAERVEFIKHQIRRLHAPFV